MTNDNVPRSCTDIDEAVLNYAEMKAIASGNPLIKEKMEVDTEVSRLNLLRKNYLFNRYNLEKDYKVNLPEKKEKLEELVDKIKKDIVMRNDNPMFGNVMRDEYTDIYMTEMIQDESTSFSMTIHGKEYTERKEAGELLLNVIKQIPADGQQVTFGTYAGFDVSASKSYGLFNETLDIKIHLDGHKRYTFDASVSSEVGNIMRIQNAVTSGLDKQLEEFESRLEDCCAALAASKKEFEKPFAREEELNRLLTRQAELNSILSDEKKINAQNKENDFSEGENINRHVV